MRIEQIRIRNYRVFRNVIISDIPQMAVFVGANGSGKSTLFDVFGFLRDALVHNVRQALARRGGFGEVITRGADGPIEIELKFREKDGPLVTYLLSVGLDEDGIPTISHELLKYRRGQHGKPWHFLDFANGRGLAVTNEDEYEQTGAEADREEQELESRDILALKGLGQFSKYKVVSAFRKLIENWHLSDFHITEARPSREAGLAEHLSPVGDNLPLVAQYMYESHKDVFDEVLGKMAERVPGVSGVEAVATEDGRIVLKFRDGSFKDPFMAKYVSDGTIKMFAYLLLLHDPAPHPLLCVEEPENQLYPKLVAELAEEFREYARRGGQVFVSTHSPEFLVAAAPEEVFWLAKLHGVSSVVRASSKSLLRRLLEEGDTLGQLWQQGFFEMPEEDLDT